MRTSQTLIRKDKQAPVRHWPEHQSDRKAGQHRKSYLQSRHRGNPGKAGSDIAAEKTHPVKSTIKRALLKSVENALFLPVKPQQSPLMGNHTGHSLKCCYKRIIQAFSTLIPTFSEKAQSGCLTKRQNAGNFPLIPIPIRSFLSPYRPG